MDYIVERVLEGHAIVVTADVFGGVPGTHLEPADPPEVSWRTVSIGDATFSGDEIEGALATIAGDEGVQSFIDSVDQELLQREADATPGDDGRWEDMHLGSVEAGS